MKSIKARINELLTQPCWMCQKKKPDVKKRYIRDYRPSIPIGFAGTLGEPKIVLDQSDKLKKVYQPVCAICYDEYLATMHRRRLIRSDGSIIWPETD